uniref:G_PROTEIN_RECEP_F1_2 domain-containing protein n=1 Tax=Macrostomum lignano TaxID=282301 RepID=A0A1I8J8A6_9PLAT
MTAQLAKLAIDLAFSEAATTATTMTTTATIMSTTMANNTTIASPGAAREPDYSPPVMVLLGLLASIASFVTVVGNLLVVTAFFVERQLRSATNYFIASLAITDLLIGMFSMNLYTLYLLLGQWPLGRIVCDLWLSLDYTACLTSQYTVFCITVDRFCSVKIPAKYRKWRTERKVQVMVAATWVLPALLFVPPIFAWPYVASSQRNDNECFAEFSEDPVYNTVLTICYFWVTLAVMIGLYIGIYRVALQLARKSEAKRQKVNNLINLSSTGGGGAGGNGGRGGGGGAGGAAGRPAASESAATSGATGGHAGVGGGDVGDDGGPHDPLMPSNRKAALLPKRWWRQQLNSGEREGGRGGSSPVWKRRTSFQRSSDCRRNSETTKTTAAATPTATTEDAFLTDRIVTSVVELPASGNSCELTILDQTDEEAPRARTSASRRVAAVSQVTRYLRDATRRIRRQVGSRAAGKTLKLAKKQSRTENRARKALKTISLILGAFVACWTPYHVFILIRSICKGTCLNPHLYNLGYWLCYMNSPINPFCYALANAQFKKTFLRIFRLDLR